MIDHPFTLLSIATEIGAPLARAARCQMRPPAAAATHARGSALPRASLSRSQQGLASAVVQEMFPREPPSGPRQSHTGTRRSAAEISGEAACGAASSLAPAVRDSDLTRQADLTASDEEHRGGGRCASSLAPAVRDSAHGAEEPARQEREVAGRLAQGAAAAAGGGSEGEGGGGERQTLQMSPLEKMWMLAAILQRPEGASL